MLARLARYRFRSTWTLPGTAAAVFEALQDLPGYVAWWPEVKEVGPAGPEAFRLRVRSFLPYDLVFEVSPETADPERGILAARLTGDLEGATRWSIGRAGDLVSAVFDEEVVTNKASLRLLAPIARPAFSFNHTLMMRNGERGLRRLLSSGDPRPG